MSRFARDMLIRTARTFVQGFLGVVTVDAFSSGFDATLLQTLGMGALAGVFAILTAFAAKPVGNPADASFLSKHRQ
jgi:Putative lactococcus lactis phage r1t holin